MELSFIVEGKPQGKGRPRFTKSGHAYTPKGTAEYERLIQASYLAKYGKLMIEHDKPIAVHIKAVFQPPSSISEKKRQWMIKKDFPTKKPDIDNICKVYMDAMNKLVYADDKQVVAVTMQKTYGMKAHVEVIVEVINDGTL